MKNIVKMLVVVMAFAWQSCSKNNGFVVEGTVQNLEVKTVYLEKVTGQVQQIDSMQVSASGEYKLIGTAETPGIYRINFGNRRAVDLVLDNASVVELNIDGKLAMNEYELKGSDESLKIKEINGVLYDTYKQVEALQEEYSKMQGDANIEALREDLERRYADVMKSQDEKIKEFTKGSTGAIVDFYAASYLNVDDHFEFLKALFEEHKAVVQNSEYTKQFYDRFQKFAQLAVGSAAPEINLAGVDGKTIALSSLKGKVVMIDFWASWCGPCRAENPNNVRLYKQYHDRGFEIYGVSLDKSREDWLEAIAKDQLSWPQVSDLKYWDSEAARLYQIEAIPATVLLDKDGIIIAKNLRGQALEQFLKKLFN